MVTKYLGMGMPETKTGRIDWKKADAWRKANISPELSGNYHTRHRKEAIDPFSGLLPDKEEIERAAYRCLFDRILSQRNRIAGILAEAGFRDPILLHIADDLFALLVCEFAGDLDPYDWDIEDIPLVDVDYRSLTDRFGLQFTSEVIEAADAMIDRIYNIISEEVNGENQRR
jgi:hypothetical protein